MGAHVLKPFGQIVRLATLRDGANTIATQLKQMLIAAFFLLFFISVCQALEPHPNPTSKEGTTIDSRACREGGGTYTIDRDNRAVTRCTYPNGDVTTCDGHQCDTCDSGGFCRPGGRIVPGAGAIKPPIRTAPTNTMKDSGQKKPQRPTGISRPASNVIKAHDAPTLNAPSNAK
jgi:hypothetical protein